MTSTFKPLALLKWVFVVSLVLGLIFATSYLFNSTKAHALDTNCDGECQVVVPDVVDVCRNLEGIQKEVPTGYHLDQSQDNYCVSDPKPEVLGTSTVRQDPKPQVLADTTFSGK